MPFQSNPNAGAFDPNLLGMLFAERDKRREAERQAMLDQAKMQQDAMKFAMEQAKAQREEERADRKHRLDILKGEADLFSSLGEKLAAGERAAAIVPESIRRQAQGDFLSGQAPGNAVLTQNLTGTEEGMRALNKLAGENPQEAIRQGQAATQAFGRAQSISGDPVYDRLVSFLSEEFGMSPDDIRTSGAIGEARGELDKEAAVEAERIKADEDSARILGRSRILDQEAYDRSLTKESDTVIAFDNEIQRQARIANDPTNPPEVRADALRRQGILLEEREADIERNRPESSIAERAAKRKARAEYTAAYGTMHALEQIYRAAKRSGGATIGTQASIASGLATFRGVIEDAMGMPFVDFIAREAQEQYDAAIEAGDRETAARIETELLNPSVLRQIAEGKVTEIEANFAMARVNNPSGRVTNAMMDRFGKASDYMGFLNPSNQGFATLEANIIKQRRNLKQIRENIETDWPGHFSFDPKTGEMIPLTRIDAADDALYGDTEGSAKERDANPRKLKAPQIKSLIEFDQKKRGVK